MEGRLRDIEAWLGTMPLEQGKHMQGFPGIDTVFSARPFDYGRQVVLRNFLK